MSGKALQWLLEGSSPAIRYRTLTEICGQTPAECRETYAQIWMQKTVVGMMNRQDEDGLWEKERRYYGGFLEQKYLVAFAEHGLQADDRLDRLVDAAVWKMQSAEPGELGGCAAPLTLRALVMMGYHARGDVEALLARFVNEQLFDGGFMCKRLLDRRPDRKSCYKAALQGLLLYAECKRKNILPGNAECLIRYFLKRDVFYSSDKSKPLYGDGGRVGWRFIDNFFPAEPMRVGLPLIVSALAILGVGDHSAMAEAWRLLEAKADENGILKLEGTLAKQPCSFGAIGTGNEWMTFYALRAKANHGN